METYRLKEIRKYQKKIKLIEEELSKEIEKKVENLPQNKFLDDKTYKHLKIINYSGWSSNNWTPEYYDFKHQYKIILYGLQNLETFEKKLKFIKHILKDKKIDKKKNGWYHQSCELHFEVVDKIKQIYEQL